MASRVLYIERTDRGSKLANLRLVTLRAAESWPAGSGEDGEETLLDRAVKWLAARVPAPAKVSMLVLDASGAACSWATVPSADPTLVDAVVRQHAGGFGEGRGDESASDSAGGVFEFFAPGPNDSTIQALAWPPQDEPALDGRRRAGVIAVSDGIARVLLDKIDRSGIECGFSCTIWHALGLAWDPSAASHTVPEDGGRVVADSVAGPVAVIAIEPQGRLLWCWSRGGRILAGGAMRLAMRRSADGDPAGDVPLLTTDVAGRLAADWLAWSSQVAAAPDRVVVLSPELSQENAGGSMDAGAFGRAIAAGWPGASVDVMVDADPVGATLRRVADVLDEREDVVKPQEAMDPSRSLVSLTTRQGGSHRKLYVWSSLAVTAAAVVVGTVAWGLRVQASRLNVLAHQVEASWKETFKQVKLARTPMPGMEVMDLQTEVERAKRESAPLTGLEQARPIVREFETLSNVLALPDFELTSISLDSRVGSVLIQVNAPNLASAEALSEALGRIAGSEIVSWTFVPGSRAAGSDKVPCTYTGSFPPSATSSAAGGSS